LSEDDRRRVVLLEAGPDYPDPTLRPAELDDAGRNAMTTHDWGYRHRPTSGPLRLPFPRGRVVGGSSAVNTCIALRGQPEDYDEWAARGLPEWSWQACLPAFKKLECDLDFENDWHGGEGPLPIRRHPREEWVNWQAAFVDGCRSRGFPDCEDVNAPGAHGVGPHAMNKVRGRRVNVAEAYLPRSVRRRTNLELWPHRLVRRIRFHGNKVTGVEMEDDRTGQVETLETDRVILCAGAINTPGILLRSGIGPRNQVEHLGCEPVADVPAVGARLLDHPGTAIFLRPRLRGGSDRHDPLIQTVLRYASSGAEHPSDMLLQPGSKVNLPRMDLPLVSLMCAVGKPRATGVLRWTSADPRARPHIDSRLFADPEDRARATEAMQLAFELAENEPLRDVARPFLPPRTVLRNPSLTERWIRRACDSGYHPCGTVPMGGDGDPEAATDGRGRVHGVQGLAVADASLMPTIPSSNIHLTTLMIAERIASWLRSPRT
jgi:choline dehydrogenase